MQTQGETYLNVGDQQEEEQDIQKAKDRKMSVWSTNTAIFNGDKAKEQTLDAFKNGLFARMGGRAKGKDHQQEQKSPEPSPREVGTPAQSPPDSPQSKASVASN